MDETDSCGLDRLSALAICQKGELRGARTALPALRLTRKFARALRHAREDPFEIPGCLPEGEEMVGRRHALFAEPLSHGFRHTSHGEAGFPAECQQDLENGRGGVGVSDGVEMGGALPGERAETAELRARFGKQPVDSTRGDGAPSKSEPQPQTELRSVTGKPN